MQIIKKPSERVDKVWGKQKIKETIYRLMRYLISQETEQGTLLHNVVTGELVLLDEAEVSLLKDLPCIYQEAMHDLVEKHFLVPEEFDEYKSVHQLRTLLSSLNRPKGITGFTILPTMNCNARCFYCYESDCEKINMSEETADEVVRFITSQAGDKKVSLSWFGGEPLVGMKRIDQICQGLQDAGVEYHSTMISNGYLFDEQTVNCAKELWKLGNVQITLDGTEEIYNRVKAYVSSSGSPYQRVLNNIECLLKKEISVSVRMNLDYYNADNLSFLIDELEKRFSGYKRFHAYVHVLFDDEGYEKVVHTEEDKLYLNRKCSELTEKLMNWETPGKSGSLPYLKFRSCMADNEATALIYPDGSLAKCEHFMDEQLGNLKDGFTDTGRIRAWKQAVELDICRACALFPKCIRLKNCPSSGECFDSYVQSELDRYRKIMKDVWSRKMDADVTVHAALFTC